MYLREERHIIGASMPSCCVTNSDNVVLIPPSSYVQGVSIHKIIADIMFIFSSEVGLADVATAVTPKHSIPVLLVVVSMSFPIPPRPNHLPSPTAYAIQSSRRWKQPSTSSLTSSVQVQCIKAKSQKHSAGKQKNGHDSKRIHHLKKMSILPGWSCSTMTKHILMRM